MEQPTFHTALKNKIDHYIHSIYSATRTFPKEEIYGVTSQLRRASLSVMLNYIEGYSRFRDKVHLNFLEISYGSLKESIYLLEFCCDEKYIGQNLYDNLRPKADEIGAMLWGIIRGLDSNNNRKAK